MKLLFKNIGLVAIGLFVSAERASAGVEVPTGYAVSIQEHNVAGGLSYLPDGDVLAMTADYVNGPALYRFDANGDGYPAGGELLIAQFSSDTFPSFVAVAPSGKFALVGDSGAGGFIYKVEVATSKVEQLLVAPGNFDVAFVDDDHAFLSANPGAFNPGIPNRISYLTISPTPVSVPAVEIFGTPSGPISLDTNGDLYYIKGTFSFPAPLGSSTLMKFSGSDLSFAIGGGYVLGENASSLAVPLDGAYDLALNHPASKGVELYVTTISNVIFKLSEPSFAPTVFANLTAGEGDFPAFTFLAIHRPTASFAPDAPGAALLGVSVATEGFSKFGFIDIRPGVFDTDNDGTPDGKEACGHDPLKIVPGICGCGNPEADTNADGIIDCGNPRLFAANLVPLFSGISAPGISDTSPGAAKKIYLEKLADAGAKYQIEFKGPETRNRGKKIETSSSVFDMTKYKKGTYTVRFRIAKSVKVGRKTSTTYTLWTLPITYVLS